MEHKAREGEFIETFEGVLFDVKGLVHPPDRIVAFIRYFPKKEGERERKGRRYGKVYSLAERYQLLQKQYPQYLVYDPVFDQKLCEVPKQSIRKQYKPVEKLHELRTQHPLHKPERQALQLTTQLKETADIPWHSIGISGSIMAGTHTPNSDIDPVVYGTENCRKAYSALKELLDDASNSFQSYTIKGLKELYQFRSQDTHMNFEDFARTESRKPMQGKYQDRHFFIRFVKDWPEVTREYGDRLYQKMGYTKIKATVKDDTQSIFTPCTYQIEDAQVLGGTKIRSIREIVSFRGRFCDQARKDEEVIAQGKVERVIDKKQNQKFFRLLLGNKPKDYMKLT